MPPAGRCDRGRRPDPVRDGRGQRHARLVLRRRRVVRAEPAVEHGLELVAQGADLVDVGGRVHPPRRRSGRPSRRSCAGCSRWWPSSPRRARGSSVDTMRAEVAAAGRSQAGASWSTTSAAAWPTPRWPRSWPTPGCRTSSCTGARTAPTCSPGRRTTTWSRTLPELTGGWRTLCAARRQPRADRARPRVRVRQAAEHSWRLLAQLGRAAGAGLPGAGRRLAQVVPRPAGRAGGCPAPAGGRARRRDRGDHGHRRPAGAWGGAGAPRALQPRRGPRRGAMEAAR